MPDLLSTLQFPSQSAPQALSLTSRGLCLSAEAILCLAITHLLKRETLSDMVVFCQSCLLFVAAMQAATFSDHTK